MYGKKAFLIYGIVLLMISFCACNKETRQYGHAPVINELEWGMTREEIEDIENISELNATAIRSEQSTAYIILRYKETKLIFNQPCYVNFLVTTDESEIDWNCPSNSLSAIVLQYESANYEKLKESMKEKLGKPSNEESSDNTEVLVWNSEDTIKDLNRNEKEQLEQYCKKHLVNGKSIYPQDENTSINKITLGVGKDKKAVVTYYGDWSVYINYLHKK